MTTIPENPFAGRPPEWKEGYQSGVDAFAAELKNAKELLVNRFLAWPLPVSVCSDACVTVAGDKHRTGTNLLTADEARQMIEYLIQPSARR